MAEISLTGLEKKPYPQIELEFFGYGFLSFIDIVWIPECMQHIIGIFPTEDELLRFQ